MLARVAVAALCLFVSGPACAPAAPPAAPAAATAKPADTKPLEAKPVAATPAPAKVSEAAGGAPRRGGSLRVGLQADPTTLDPHFSTNAVDRQIFYAVYNNLVGLDRELKAQPELAESVDVSDPMQIVFKLRSGVKFHDGTDFDAAAVKWNFERMIDPNGGSIRRSELGSIGAVETPDPLTVVLKLKAPDSSILATLTDRAGMMVSPAAVQKFGKDFARNPVGTGPWQFVEWMKDDHITVRRNEAYWRSDAPLLDEIVFKPVPDSNQRITALRTGTFDIVEEVPPKDLATLRSDPNLDLFELAGIGYYRIELNVIKPPFDNRALRQAVAWAIDRESIAQAAYFGTGAPGQGPIPPASWAFDPSFEGYGMRANVQKAKEKLAEAGRPDGFRFTLNGQSEPLTNQVAQIVQEQLREAGIAVEISLLESAANTQRRSQGDFEGTMSLWSGRVDPDGNMFSHFITDGANNWGKYSNPRVDELLRGARTATQLEERARLYRQAVELIADDAPAVFIHHSAWIKAASKKLQGYTELADGRMRFERVWLAP